MTKFDLAIEFIDALPFLPENENNEIAQKKC